MTKYAPTPLEQIADLVVEANDNWKGDKTEANLNQLQLMKAMHLLALNQAEILKRLEAR